MRISDWSSDVCSSDLDPRAAQELYPDFDIEVRQQDRGLRIDLKNAPAIAFVDGEIIRGVAELLAAVVRDLVYTAIELAPEYADELGTSAGVTDAVFRPLRNAAVLQPADPNLVFCCGGARKSTRLNSSHYCASRIPSSA